MDIILHAFSGIITVIIMITAGFVLERKGWFTEGSVSLIARMVTSICLPPYMLVNLMSNFTREELVDLVRGIVVPFLSIMAAYILMKIVVRLMKIPENKKGVFVSSVAFSNVIFIGMPLTIALFGEESVPYVMIYYMANTVLFWTLGVHELASDAGHDIPWLSRETLRIIFPPPLRGFTLGVILILFGITLPAPIYKSCYYIGSMTTPLAMLFIGISLGRTDWKEMRPDFNVAVAMLARYLVCPILVIIMLPFFNVSPVMGRVFVILAAMPVMTNLSIISKAYDGDYRYAAMLVTVSTCLATLVIPFYMWLVH